MSEERAEPFFSLRQGDTALLRKEQTHGFLCPYPWSVSWGLVLVQGGGLTGAVGTYGHGAGLAELRPR